MYTKEQKALTVEDMSIKLIFQTEFLTVKKGALPLHNQLHNHSYVEVFACLQGSITINTSSQAFVLNSGDVALVPPVVEHYKAPETAPGTQWLGLGFICHKINREHSYDIYSFFDGLMQYGSVVVYRDVHLLCNAIKESYSQIQNTEVSSVLALLSQIIKLPKPQTLTKDDSESSVQKSKNIDRLLKLDDIINTNFNQSFSNKDIADLLFISERQLSRIVAKNYSQPLRVIILRKRLDVAAELLLTTREGVEHIGLAVGFKNMNSFHREFKKRFGVTPAEYRKK